MADALSVVAYTAICGRYDMLRHTGRARPSSGRFVCFTDELPGINPYLGWHMKPAVASEGSARMNAKWHQVMAHATFGPDVDASIYMDGTHVLRESWTPEALAAEFLEFADVAAFHHGERDCAYEEAERVIELGLDDAGIVRGQMARYRAEGFPEHWGLPAITMLLRRHTPAVAKLCELWWREIRAGSARDQLSFPYCLWKLGLTWDVIPGWCYINRIAHWVPHGHLASEGGYADVVPY